MICFKKSNLSPKILFILSAILSVISILSSCSSFTYITYERNEQVEDPEPNYSITLNPNFQEYVNFMFIGNRINNFSTYFNTFYNAIDNYNDAFDDYQKGVLEHYSERLDSILIGPKLTPTTTDNFNKAIEKASKVIQYHKSTAFIDKAVMLIGKSYFFLGDYLKAERKFNEFISKLALSPYIEEAYLFLAMTELRLKNTAPALEQLNKLISTSKNSDIVARAYQSLAEYYISQKDYESAIKDYKKSIELSSDKSFKAQLQFIIATIVACSEPLKGSEEYKKILDYSPSFDLEYFARYNTVKYAILGGNYNNVLNTLDRLEVSYKDNLDLLPQISYLRGLYYEQRKDYKKEVKQYQLLIQTYPKTVSSSDASFSLAKYKEYIANDYLNAYRFYRFSMDESNSGHNYYQAFEKSKIFKKYFDLRSIIADTVINTDYDSLFNQFVLPKNSIQMNGPGNENQNKEQGKGKGGGSSLIDCSDTIKDKIVNHRDSIGNKNLRIHDTLKSKYVNPGDTLKNKYVNPGDSSKSSSSDISDSLKNLSMIDSEKVKADRILNAKFELSELFIYDLNKPDSAEYYLKESYAGSDNQEFKCKVLFAQANLYRAENKNDKADETFKRLIDECPFSILANESRKLLGVPQIDLETHDEADSIYQYGAQKFANSEYPSALTAFQDIVSNHTGSKHYFSSAYAAGWIYENILIKPDSAFNYYSKILSADPSSDMLKMVSQKITLYQQELNKKNDTVSTKLDTTKTDSLKNIPDSLKLKLQENQEIKNNDSDKSGIQDEKDNRSEKDKNGSNSNDMKKEENPVSNPEHK